MAQRVVVTGRREGREGIVHDVEVNSVDIGGVDIAVLFEGAAVQSVPNSGGPPRRIAEPADIRFPPAGDVLVATFAVPPRSSVQPDQSPVEIAADRPGYHASETVDVDIVLTGEVAMEVEDGTEVVLRRGDCIVVNGTGHAWHNHGDELATVVSVALGGRAAGELS